MDIYVWYVHHWIFIFLIFPLQYKRKKVKFCNLNMDIFKKYHFTIFCLTGKKIPTPVFLFVTGQNKNKIPLACSRCTWNKYKYISYNVKWPVHNGQECKVIDNGDSDTFMTENENKFTNKTNVKIMELYTRLIISYKADYWEWRKFHNTKSQEHVGFI